MVKDYSRFLPPSLQTAPARSAPGPLQRLGWQPFFLQQTADCDLERTPPVRVVSIRRSGLRVLGADTNTEIPPMAGVAVGDWLLLNPETPKKSLLLDRKSLFKRRAAGSGRDEQLIAANVETLFVVTSCNDDFSVARIERYLALAFEAETEAVVVLTKTDTCEDPQDYAARARQISARVPVAALNARDPMALGALSDWCRPGQTVAFLGSSGVGKSTLINGLLGHAREQTGSIRDSDSKGRHTTTARALHVMGQGGLLLDTPGMRELQITDVQAGLAGVFPDIEALARQCRFRDCLHETEPGCAIKSAVDSGGLDAGRLARWRKLVAEEQFNAASLQERKAQDKSLHRLIRQIQTEKQSRR